MFRSVKIIAAVAAAGTLLGVGYPAAHAAFLLRTPLVRVAGEDPSVNPACPAAGDARWDGVLIRVGIGNMDPARFPAGAACQTEVRVGGLTRTGIPLLAAPSEGCLPIVPATFFDFRTNGVVTPGTRVQMRIRCSVAGVRHETQWAGTF